MQPAGLLDSSHFYPPNPLMLPTLLFTPFWAIPARFLWGWSKRQRGSQGVPAAPVAFLLMGMLLGQHRRAKALQLPFPGAGGEGNVAAQGWRWPTPLRSGLTCRQPLPLL